MDPYLGEIRLVSFNFAPKGWAFCNGQLMAINQNTALFSLLGTYYGGNGVSTFALPDMRSRVPQHMGSNVGQIGGAEQVTLNVNQIPTHTHMLQAVNTPGVGKKPINNLLAQSGSTYPRYASDATNLTPLNPASIQPTGSNQAHSNIQPYLAMNYCIALQGIFPSRN